MRVPHSCSAGKPIEPDLFQNWLADNQPSIVILQRSSNDFRCTRALRIDQYDQRKIVFGIDFCDEYGPVRTARASLGFHNQLIFLKERFTNFDRFLQQTARLFRKSKTSPSRSFRIRLLQFFTEFLQGIPQFLPSVSAKLSSLI
jgi:hypothetical protein